MLVYSHRFSIDPQHTLKILKTISLWTAHRLSPHKTPNLFNTFILPTYPLPVPPAKPDPNTLLEPAPKEPPNNPKLSYAPHPNTPPPPLTLHFGSCSQHTLCAQSSRYILTSPEHTPPIPLNPLLFNATLTHRSHVNNSITHYTLEIGLNQPSFDASIQLTISLNILTPLQPHHYPPIPLKLICALAQLAGWPPFSTKLLNPHNYHAFPYEIENPHRTYPLLLLPSNSPPPFVNSLHTFTQSLAQLILVPTAHPHNPFLPPKNHTAILLPTIAGTTPPALLIPTNIDKHLCIQRVLHTIALLSPLTLYSHPTPSSITEHLLLEQLLTLTHEATTANHLVQQHIRTLQTAQEKFDTDLRNYKINTTEIITARLKTDENKRTRLLYQITQKNAETAKLTHELTQLISQKDAQTQAIHHYGLTINSLQTECDALKAQYNLLLTVNNTLQTDNSHLAIAHNTLETEHILLLEKMEAQDHHLERLLQSPTQPVQNAPAHTETLPRPPQQPTSMVSSIEIISTHIPYKNRILFLPSAITSAKESDKKHFLHFKTGFELLIALASNAYDVYVSNGGDQQLLSYVFNKGNSYSAKEAETLSNTGRKQRTFLYLGKPTLMLRHLKIGNTYSYAETLRIHFHWDAFNKIIVVGHCGKHLPL